MAIGWLTVLKSVPWVDVISNAPRVADGAKKLWSAVAKKSPADELPAAGAKLAALEAAVADLHDQMLASSELIKELAEQNAQLVKRVEANRVRVLWLTGGVVAVGIIAAGSLVLNLLR